MKTVCIQIGNSDDNLSQLKWANFCDAISTAVTFRAHQVHFSAPSIGWQSWQNACWIFEIENPSQLKREVNRIRNNYDQVSIAWLEGETEFV